jgi:hypothetical protein
MISRYRASGLSLTQFAEAEGMPAGRLHYWLYQKHRNGGRERSVGSSGAASVPVFQEVSLAACLPSTASWAAEVSLSKGLVIRFNQAAPPAWIGAVLQVLQRPC